MCLTCAITTFTFFCQFSASGMCHPMTLQHSVTHYLAWHSICSIKTSEEFLTLCNNKIYVQDVVMPVFFLDARGHRVVHLEPEMEEMPVDH